jgi:DNA-binding NarL/FixJ family response regulator
MKSVFKMINSGAVAYILKDADPYYFKKALDNVNDMGMFYDELIASALKKPKTPLIEFKSREEEFLTYLCSDLTYKQIADNMNVSPSTYSGESGPPIPVQSGPVCLPFLELT